MIGNRAVAHTAAIAALILAACAGPGAPTVSTSPPAAVLPSPLPSGWTTAAGPASAAVIALLQARIDAMNRGDAEAAAALWTEDGVMFEWENGGIESRGRAAIAARLGGLYDDGLRLEAAGTPLQLGRLVAEPVRFIQAGGSGYGEGMLVFDINEDGLIVTEWATGWL